MPIINRCSQKTCFKNHRSRLVGKNGTGGIHYLFSKASCCDIIKCTWVYELRAHRKQRLHQ